MSSIAVKDTRRGSALRALAIAGSSWLLMLAIAIPASLLYDIPVRHLTRDPTHVANARFYIGMISNFGIVLWAGTTAICLLAYAILRTQGRAPSVSRFFLVSALFTLALLGDDLLQLHAIIPEFFGIRHKSVVVIYGLAALFYLYWFRAEFLRSDYAPLIVALALFAISIAIDQFPADFRGKFLLEDGTKFAGIATWFAYFFQLASDTLLDAKASTGPREALLFGVKNGKQ